MKDLLLRLTSRKFLLAVSGALAALANGDLGLAIAVVLGYLGVEGALDYSRKEQ